MGRALIALRRRQQALAIAGAAAIVGFAVGLPMLELGWALVRAGPRAFVPLAKTAPWTLLLRSVAIAAAVTAMTLPLGVPLGVAFARMRLPARRILFALHCLPMFLPPLLISLGWFHVFGRNAFAGNEVTASILFGPFGVVAVLGLTFTPIVTALTAIGVLSIDPSLEEAARTVARPLRVARSILVPAAAPAVLLGGLLVFALTLSELGVPAFLRVPVYTTAVFTRLGGIDYAPGEAAALVAPMLILGVALLAIERRYVRDRSFAVLGLRGDGREPLRGSRISEFAATAAALVAALVSIAPISALALRALAGGDFAQTIAYGAASAWTSAWVSFVAATCVATLAVVAGHALARGAAGATALDLLSMLGFFVPAAVLGAGTIGAYMHPLLRGIYGTGAVLVIGLVARYAAVGARTFAASVAQGALSYEESATAAGASYIQRIARIILPMHRRGAAAAWLLALVFALRDVDTAILFYPPGSEPLTVRIFTLEANGPEPLVAGLAILHVALTMTLVGVGAALLPRTRRR